MLSQKGYQVRPADHPQVAIDAALAQPPALILLDVRMPDMDGFELLAHMSATNDEIPVIVMTSSDQKENLLEMVKAGANDYIEKPFKAEELRKKLENQFIRVII